MLAAGFVGSLSLLTSPPMRTASVAPAAQRSALHMAASTGEQKPSFLSQVGKLNTMNKMGVVKKGQAPKLRGKRLSPAMVELTSRFKKEYAAKELQVLWAALLKIYGSQALAEQAARDNPQIINPSYSFCNTMLASEKVLVDMMGREEALDVMQKNPAVLQCGPSLDTLGPDEIKGFANLRSFFNRLVKEEFRVPALALLIAVCSFPLLANGNADLEGTGFLTANRILVGILFSVGIEGSRILIVGTIVKAKMSGDKRYAAAEAAEARRMGKRRAT